MVFHPLIYETDEELQHFLTYQGTVNVTERFESIMYAGYIIYGLAVAQMFYGTIVNCIDPW